jgi:hypothetical protein
MISANEGMAVVSAFAALVLTAVAFALAVAALRARALLVAGVCASLVAAIASAALLANNAVLPAVALAVFGAALLLVWVLGGMLLSANSVKAGRRGAPWLTFLSAFATAGVILAVTPEFAATRAAPIAEPVGLPALLSALMFVAGFSVIGLIGYGERGALEGRGRDEP